MAVYIIAHFTIDDPKGYTKYVEGFFPLFNEYDGEVVAVDDFGEILEGDVEPGRTVILRFPSRERAMEWYRSPEYQKLAAHRLASTRSHLLTLIDEQPREDILAQL